MTGRVLSFDVPAAARAGVLAEFANRPGSVQRRSCTCRWFDTPDRRLQRKGLGWRLRREGRQWWQTVSALADDPWSTGGHEVLRPGDTPDPTAHAGTAIGERLLAQWRKAGPLDGPPNAWLAGDWRRLTRRIRSRGAVIEVDFDTVRLTAGDASHRFWRLHVRLCSGPAAAWVALAERWRSRYALPLDLRSLIERVVASERGEAIDPPRRAALPAYPGPGEPHEAQDVLGSIVDQCLAQVVRNAAAVASADPAQTVEHVHQLRVGVRRLRSALRLFDTWTPPPPDPLVSGLRDLFAALGAARDEDVLASGVALELQAVGAPPLEPAPPHARPDPRRLLQDPAAQQLLLAWLGWRHTALGAEPTALTAQALTAEALASEEPTAAAEPLAERAARRLRRWHRRIAREARQFAQLEEQAVHALRKRIKRQRYAAELLAPLLRPRATQRYLAALAAAQQHLGQLNDLYVARTRYQDIVQQQPAAWFALGWLTARIADGRLGCMPTLQALADAQPPAAAG